MWTKQKTTGNQAVLGQIRQSDSTDSTVGFPAFSILNDGKAPSPVSEGSLFLPQQLTIDPSVNNRLNLNDTGHNFATVIFFEIEKLQVKFGVKTAPSYIISVFNSQVSNLPNHPLPPLRQAAMTHPRFESSHGLGIDWSQMFMEYWIVYTRKYMKYIKYQISIYIIYQQYIYISNINMFLWVVLILFCILYTCIQQYYLIFISASQLAGGDLIPGHAQRRQRLQDRRGTVPCRHGNTGLYIHSRST